jgi:hypothetical protein
VTMRAKCLLFHNSILGKLNPGFWISSLEPLSGHSFGGYRQG